MLEPLLNLIAPVACAGCGTSGAYLCQECRLRARGQLRDIDSVPLISVYGASGELTRAVALWKDSNVRQLGRQFAQDAAAVVRKLKLGSDIVCVPVPARTIAVRRRGWRPIDRLSADLAAALAVPSRRSLTLARSLKDQRKLNDFERMQNLRNSMIADSLSGNWLLVDDVSTSGATLREAIRAAQSAGNSVKACLVLVTPRTKPTNFSKS